MFLASSDVNHMYLDLCVQNIKVQFVKVLVIRTKRCGSKILVEHLWQRPSLYL